MNLRQSYDRVADEYVRRIYDELRHKPLDQQLLERLAASVKGKGLCCDIGCGSGHVARYLHEHGAQICGIDLADEMIARARDLNPGIPRKASALHVCGIARARDLNPGIPFEQGDMRALQVPDSHLAAITAFYSLIHIPPADMVTVLRELRRVLQPDGLLLAAFHIGDSTVHLDEWWGHEVSADFHFFQSDQMRAWLESAGFEIEEIIERDPYPEIEHQSRRAYIFARRSA